MGYQVTLNILNLGQVLECNLIIPDYQRDYCWGDKQLKTLLDNILEYFVHPQTKSEYRMGTVILQDKGNLNYDLIDGQQRLTTLALLIHEISEIQRNNKLEVSSLLKRSVTINTQNAINNSLFLIKKYLINKISFSQTIDLVNSLKNNITFSVLILNKDTSLDLAFTFFSSTNSRGKPLSDYDLLKAHHLRYLSKNDENKADSLASNWDNLIAPYNNKENTPIYKQVLDLYIYRLRHFWEGKDLNEDEPQRIYEEYKAAPVIDGLNPFGAKLHYAESIQGGAYFFEYANNMIDHGKIFKEITEVKKLYKYFSSSRVSHMWFAELTAAHLFAYYLKFGCQYIPEAMMLILRRLSQFRIQNNNRVDYSCLIGADFNYRICRMIERAFSPTFFLAELKLVIEKNPFDDVPDNINYSPPSFKYVIREDHNKKMYCSLKGKESNGKVTADFITRYLRLLSDIEQKIEINCIKKTVSFDYLKESNSRINANG